MQQSQNGIYTQFYTHDVDDNIGGNLDEESILALSSIRIINGKYYFRRRIPMDLLQWFRGREILKALGTSDKKLVKSLIADWETKITKVFYILRLNTVDEQFKRDLIHAEIYPDNKHTSSGKSLRLSQLITDYKAQCNDGWREKTEQEIEAILRVVLEVLGNEPVKLINHDHVLLFKDTLRKLPANMRKNPIYKDRKISEIMKMTDVEPMSITTANKYMSRLSALFEYAVKKGHMAANYASKQLIKKDSGRNTNKTRTVYADEDITRLYGLLKKDNERPERYWIPLIALFCGMRLGEICQLYKTDITKQPDNIWVIDINADSPDKKLKIGTTARKIPIPNTLIGLGLGKYVENCKTDRLWASLTYTVADGYAHQFGKWFQRLNREQITKDKNKVFHSLRHNFVNCLKQKGVNHTVIAALSGHTIGTMVNDTYSEDYRIKLLHDTINLIDFHNLPGFNLLGEVVLNNIRPVENQVRRLILD